MTERILDRLAGHADAWRRTSLAPLANPTFRALWIAAMVSNFGTVMQATGAAWLMTTLTPSATMVALVQTMTSVPIVIFGLAAGALADINDRRTMMLCALVMGAIATAVLAGLAWAGLVTPYILLTFTFFIGCSTAFYQPAWQASVGDIVPRPLLPAAVSLGALSFNAARGVGPALGGLVTAVAGVAAAFTLNALSFVGLIKVIFDARFGSQRVHVLPPEALRAAMAGGLRYVMMSPALGAAALHLFTFAFSGSVFFGLAALIAKTTLHGGPVTYGVLLGSFGIGSLAGALASAYMNSILGNDRVAALACVALAIGLIGIALSSSFPLTMVCAVFSGAGWILVTTTRMAHGQLNSPRWVAGRTLSVLYLSLTAGLSAGSAFWGWFAHQTTLSAAFLAAGCLGAGSLFVSNLLPGKRQGGLDLSPLEAPLPAAPSTPIESYSGAILVSVEYYVPPEAAATFLQTMHEIGRMRRRNGARRWAIYQDVDRLGFWIEQTESQSWLDFQRSADRRTVADEDMRARARTFMVQQNVRRLIERADGSPPID